MPDAVDALRRFAVGLADVEESIACARTALEQASYRTAGKAFLFAQRKGDVAVVRLKLETSLAQAKAGGDGVEVGKGGWVTCRLPLAKAPSAVVKRWIRESHTLFAKPAKAASEKKVAGNKREQTERAFPMQRFAAELEPVSHGGHFVVVPPAKAAAAGLKRGARVRGTINGVPFRSSLMMYSGVFHMGVHKATLAAAKATANDVVEVAIAIDDQPLPTDTVPKDLAAALARHRAAAAAWETLAPSHRREHVKAIVEAKKPETRARRIEKAVAMLAATRAKKRNRAAR